MKPQTFIFFGKSGAGKGTQVELLQQYLRKNDPETDILYIETGKIFRDFLEKDNYTAKHIKEILGAGKLLPAFLPIFMWSQSFIEESNNTEHWVMDGVCRRPEESPALVGALDFYDRKDVYVILIDVSNEWASEKLLARGRSDDTEEKIKTRLDWFEDNVIPSINYFKEKTDLNVLRINGEQTIEEVHQEVIDSVFNDKA